MWRDVTGATSTGSLALADGGDGALRLTLGLGERLNGLPPTALAVTVTRTGDLPSELGLEVETEIGVQPPAPVPFGGAAVDKREGLRAAGFALRDVGARTAIPPRDDGWDYSDIFTVLHDLMTAKAQGLPERAAWELRLLLLSRSSRRGLMGVMFDLAAPLPRQGAAVVRGEPLRIRVGYPHDTQAERDAMVLLRPDVGVWFALGGGDALPVAADDLSEIAQRRRAERGPADPVAATIARAAGINAGRRCVRYRDGRFDAEAGDPERAAALLAGLDAAALRTFDPTTAAGTARLARRYAAAT